MFGTLSQVPPVQVQSRRTGELFTVARLLTEGTGVSDFSVIHEELLPGRRGSSPHAHTVLNELFVILKGTPTVYVGTERRVVSAGDYVLFRAEGPPHWIANESDETVEWLRVAGNAERDVVVYAAQDG